MKVMKSVQAYEVLQDPQAARSVLERDGYLLVRGVFNRERIRSIRVEVLKIFKNAGILVEGTALEEGRAIPCSKVKGDVIGLLYPQAYGLESIHALWQGSDVLEIMQALIDKKDVISHPHKQVRFQFASESGAPAQITDPHQDYVYNQGSTGMYSCWAALGDLTPENGVLEVLENSHRRGLLDVYAPSPGSITYSIDEADLQGSWLTSNYQMGDMVIFHSYAVHRVPANQSDVIRISTDCRFQSISEPFNSQWMSPLPGVAEASQEWENKQLLNYWQNLDIILVAHDESYFRNIKPIK